MRNLAGFNLIAEDIEVVASKIHPNCEITFKDQNIAFSGGIPDHGYAFEVISLTSDSYFFYFEGVLLDLHGFKTAKEYFLNRLACGGPASLVADINGSFVAVYFCRASHKVSIFADHLATRKIFYRQLKTGGIAVSTRASDLLVESLGSVTLDQNAVYGFLGYGFFLDNKTYWEEIKTLRPGEVLEFDHALSVKKWCDLRAPRSQLSFDNAVDEFERHFSRAVRSIASVCARQQREVVAAISGGLDSRATLMSFIEIGCLPKYTVTFAQSGSPDERIAVSIASKLGLQNLLNRLDGGWYLTRNVLDYIVASQGRLSYHTAIHGFDTYSKLCPLPSGLLVSGQIGDVLFGSFMGKSGDISVLRDYSYSGVRDDYIHQKIGFDSALFESYSQKGLEFFNLEQRQSNGTISGDLFIRQYFDTVSPFFDRELVQLSLSLPPEFRAKNRLQFEWMSRFHKPMTNFAWDKTGLRPKWRLTSLLAYNIKRLSNKIQSKLHIPTGMNPFQFWLKSNQRLGEYLDVQIETRLKRGVLPESLTADLRRLAEDSRSAADMRRAVVLTVLLVVQELKPTQGSGLFSEIANKSTV